MINQLVIDRSQTDVAAKNGKGTYNAADLNRVGQAMTYLAGEFNRRGYAVSVSSRRDWAVGEAPTESAMALYLRDVQALRETFAVMQSTPAVPERMGESAPGMRDGLNWQRANDIERVLTDLDTLLQGLVLELQYANQPLLFAGYGLHPASPGEPLLLEDLQELLTEDGTELLYY